MGRKTQTILEHATILAEQIQNNPEDWEKRRDALLTMQRVVEEAGASGVFDANVWRSLKEPLKNTLNDLRSTMVKEACSLLETISTVSGNLMSGLLRDLLTVMLQLVANGNSVIAARVDSCLKHVIKHTRFPRQLKEVEFRLKDTRSKETRVCISSYLLLMLREWPSASIDKDAAHVEGMIKVLLADASNDARADARASFAIFRLHWPKRAEKILEGCDPRTAKALSPGSSDSGGDGMMSSTERVIHSASPSRSHSLPDSRATSSQGRRAASSTQGHEASGGALEADGVKRASSTRRDSLTGASPGRGAGGAKSGRQASNSSTPSGKAGIARSKTRSIPPATPLRSKASAPSVPVSGSRHVKRSNGEKSTASSSSSLHGTAISVTPGSNRVLAEASTASHSKVDQRQETALVSGDKVRLKGTAERQATVRFVGNTQFASGIWVGVELLENEEPSGNNNGSVNGVPYFRCPPARGIFLRPDMVQLEDGTELNHEGESRGRGFSLQEEVNDVDAAAARFAANARGKSMEGGSAAVAVRGGDNDDDDVLRRACAELLQCHTLFVEAMLDSIKDEINTIPGLERLVDSDSPLPSERLCFYRDMLECDMEEKLTLVSTLRAQVHSIQTAYPDVFNIAPLPSTCPCTPVGGGGKGVDGNFDEGKDEEAHSFGATFKNGVDRRLFGPDEGTAATQEERSTSRSTSTSPASLAPSTSSLPSASASASASACTPESTSVVNIGDVSPRGVGGYTAATPSASSSPKDRNELTPNTQAILSPIDLNGAEDNTSENSWIEKEMQAKDIQNAGYGIHEALSTD